MRLPPALGWLVESSELLPEGSDWLGPRELAVLAGLRFPKRRADWLLGRWTAKRTVRAMLESPAATLSDIEILAAADGAPELSVGGVPCGLRVSISHSAPLALCVAAVDGHAPGCDIEKVEVRPPFLLEDYFVEDEVRYVRLQPPAERAVHETLVWSAKESALKSLRSGLRRDTRSVVFRPGRGRAAKGWQPFEVECLETGGRFHGWWRTHGDFVLAITSNSAAAEPAPAGS